MVSLAGPQRRWMAAIFVHTDVPPERNKHPDIAEDNSLGRSRGGLGTKIHLTTGGSGLPLNFVLSPGQGHESQFAQRLLDSIGVQRQKR